MERPGLAALYCEDIPVVVKGVLNPDDAERAAKAGVAGVIVSDHGGRNLDTVPATIEALPLVVERIAHRLPVLVDGGIRRGTDVLNALALGAKAVLIGRPYIRTGSGWSNGGKAGSGHLAAGTCLSDGADGKDDHRKHRLQRNLDLRQFVS